MANPRSCGGETFRQKKTAGKSCPLPAIVFLLIRFAGASAANLSHPAEPSQRRPLILSVSSEAPAATPASVETAVCFAEPGTAFVVATD